MTSPSEVPPEGQRFDEFIEIAVDDTPVFRIEQVPEANLSAPADAAIALFLQSLCTDIEKEIELTYGKSIEEIIQNEDPDVVIAQTGAETWTDLLEETR